MDIIVQASYSRNGYEVHNLNFTCEPLQRTVGLVMTRGMLFRVFIQNDNSDTIDVSSFSNDMFTILHV